MSVTKKQHLGATSKNALQHIKTSWNFGYRETPKDACKLLPLVDSLMRLEVNAEITSLACWIPEQFNVFLRDKLDALETVEILIVK